MKATLRSSWRDDRGATLVLFGLLIGVLIGMAALVTDVGVGYWNRRAMQNAVDAAALAGAWLLPNDQGAADVQARAYGVANGLLAAEITDVDFSCQTWNQAAGFCNDTITVRAARQLPPLLAGVLGQAGFTVRVQATAITTANAAGHLVPFGVGAGTDLSGSVMLKGGAGTGTDGNYRAVSFDNNNATPDYRTWIGEGYNEGVPDPLPPDGWEIQTKTGAVAGPTIDELWKLMVKEPNNDCRKPDGTPWAVVPGTTTPNLNSLMCPRVVIVPLLAEEWDDISGSQPVHVVGFAAFRIDNVICTSGPIDLSNTTPTHGCSPAGSAQIQGRFIGTTDGAGGMMIDVPLDYSGSRGVFLWQ